MRDLDEVGPCRIQDGRTGGDRRLSWDLDVGELPSWMWAQHVCVEECPLLAACTEQRDRLYPRTGSGPPSVIWAGVAYGDTGQVLDKRGLRRRAATKRSRGLRDGSAAPATRIKAG